MINIEDLFSFSNNDIIVVGCSTGPDSMALLDMLLKIRNKYQLMIIVAHVNHNIRKQSFEEAEFLKKYCESNMLLFESMVIEEYGDDNFHNEARNIRYHFFETVVNKYHARYLMTAHHGDDLIETVLMRLVRGSNITGYSGFRKVVPMDSYDIIRPLISCTKKELLDYDKENSVPYYIDDSNDKDKYTRNRYRKYILPFLKKESPLVHLKFLQYSNTLNEAATFIEEERNKALDRVYYDGMIDISLFLMENDFIQKEIIYYLLEKFYQDDLILIRNKHIEIILNLIHSKSPNSRINLPNDVIALKNYQYLIFRRETEVFAGYEMEFDQYVLLPNNHYIERVEMEESNSNSVCRLDSHDLVLPLIVRSRKIGDKIKVKGLNGTKKIKDIFIDKKISASKRDYWPIVLDSSGKIVWIPGVKKSVFDKNKSESYDIILKYS